MKAEIVKLREQQKKLVADARAKLDQITDETPAERAKEIEVEYDKIMAEYDAIEERVARVLKQDEAEARMAAGSSQPPRGENR